METTKQKTETENRKQKQLGGKVMKTTKQETENKSQRSLNAILKTAAVLASVVLVSFTVSAQGLWKQFLTYNSFGKMAELLVSESELSNANVSTELPTGTDVYNFEEFDDEALEIEPWMTETDNFGSTLNFEVKPEDSLEIENWMTNNNNFKLVFTAEVEEELKLETWMTSL